MTISTYVDPKICLCLFVFLKKKMKIKGIISLLSDRKEIDFVKELFLLKGKKENIKKNFENFKRILYKILKIHLLVEEK